MNMLDHKIDVSSATYLSLSEGDAKHTGFANLRDALDTALYVETLLSGEREWITNRLSWLFTSQSFLILALVTYLVSGKKLGPRALLRIDLGPSCNRHRHLCICRFSNLCGGS